VAGVRDRWQAEPERYEGLFDEMAAIVKAARQVIESGPAERLGPLMDQNHAILQKIGVSCPELERLVDAAHKAGAWGTKLSGGGQGGNMLALVRPQNAEAVAAALTRAGAVRTITTSVQATAS
jgi:mevalonate kinase